MRFVDANVLLYSLSTAPGQDYDGVVVKNPFP